MYLYNKKQDLLKFSIISLIVIACVIYLPHCLNRDDKPNVLLVSIDSLRSDHLSCYGYKRNTSPTIDELAKEGVLFSKAFAQSSHTATSLSTILTSTLPHTHSLLEWGYTLNPNLSTIAEVLKSKGYKTMFVGSGINNLHGFNKGFDIFYVSDNNSHSISSRIIKFFEKNLNKPFFVWVHYFDAHRPYTISYPPARSYYSNLFINDELYDKEKELPVIVKAGHEKISGRHLYFGGIPEELYKKKRRYIVNPDYYIAQYDGAIRAIDNEIGRMLSNLIGLKLDKKTMIIITSDHGELFGEHNYYFFHGCFLYEPLIRVPLIIKYDKIIPRDKVINTQVSAHLDIAPTILDILRIDKAKKMEGVSLLGIILGKEKYPCPYIFSDVGHAVKSIINNEWKLIYTGSDNTGFELYNLKNDSAELNNLVYSEKNKIKFLKQKLDKYKHANFQKPVFDEDGKTRLRFLRYIQ